MLELVGRSPHPREALVYASGSKGKGMSVLSLIATIMISAMSVADAGGTGWEHFESPIEIALSEINDRGAGPIPVEKVESDVPVATCVGGRYGDVAAEDTGT
jgi:hypothetical protein